VKPNIIARPSAPRGRPRRMPGKAITAVPNRDKRRYRRHNHAARAFFDHADTASYVFAANAAAANSVSRVCPRFLPLPFVCKSFLPSSSAANAPPYVAWHVQTVVFARRTSAAATTIRPVRPQTQIGNQTGTNAPPCAKVVQRFDATARKIAQNRQARWRRAGRSHRSSNGSASVARHRKRARW